MRNKIAITKPIKAYMVAMGAQEQRAYNVEGMTLLRGRAGGGKTWGTAFVSNRVHGVFVRAQRIWSITSMLAAIVEELRGKPVRFKQPMFNFIVKKLRESNRPLFVDEADYLNEEMIDVIRDIYDCSRRPVVLIGMDDIARGLATNDRFMRRITQEVEMAPLDMDDCRMVARDVCEVGVADELLGKLHREAGGNVGLISNGLAAIEQMARANGTDSVDLKTWGERRLFFGGKKRKRNGR